MFKLPELKYSYKALEPYIDAKTMEIHHTKHHAGYVNKLNKALEDTDLLNTPVEEILRGIDSIDSGIKQSVINNGGGHANHSLFWSIMSPSGTREPMGNLLKEIDGTFGSFEDLKGKFKDEALIRFGSGWAWLVVNDGRLEIVTTPNQDSPLMEGYTPILGLDVWEHAYYLNYQNRRGDYIDAFWNLVDWEAVESLFVATSQ